MDSVTTCSSCKHWDRSTAAADPAEPLGWGRCAIVPDGNGPTATKVAENVSAESFEGWETWLDTRGDFGCVNHARASRTRQGGRAPQDRDQSQEEEAEVMEDRHPTSEQPDPVEAADAPDGEGWHDNDGPDGRCMRCWRAKEFCRLVAKGVPQDRADALVQAADGTEWVPIPAEYVRPPADRRR